jgi:hypothetical protein
MRSGTRARGSWDLIISGGIALALIAPLAFFPIAKLLWLAVDLYIQPEH